MRYQIELKKLKLSHAINLCKVLFWFSVGAVLAFFLLVSFMFIIFQKNFNHRVYPGVMVNGVNFGGKSAQDVKVYFNKKNDAIKDTQFIFTSSEGVATISALQIHLGFDSDLLSQQAMSIGRSKDLFSNVTIITESYLSGINLPTSYRYSEDALTNLLMPLVKNLTIDPVDALFTFENGRVATFKPSNDGQDVDREELQSLFLSKAKEVLTSGRQQIITIAIPIKVIKPAITTDRVNNLGIKELIGSGTSLFQHSIDTRIFNVTLAAKRISGVLVKSGDVFSFAKALGDISAFTGYKQAYVIENGKTVLGDGGGVCQVSTTLFRAILNAGLPVLERHAHAYRVGYYEEDSPPGIDATVYVPTVDLKFKNDTDHYILIQSVVDPNELRLTFYLYGAKDNRQVTISTPIVTQETPPPEAKYQDDPTLPKGVVKQVDFAAAGANVYFTRQVVKDGKTIISERYTSNYQPWQAVYLRGTM